MRGRDVPAGLIALERVGSPWKPPSRLPAKTRAFLPCAAGTSAPILNGEGAWS